MKNFLKFALFLYFLLAMVFFVGHGWAQDKKIIIGGKNFTEQYILPEMAKILFEKQGFNVTLKTGVGSTVLRQALRNGQVDLCFEYTGTAYTVYLKQKNRAVMTDPEKVFNYVTKADAQKGLVWLPPMAVNSTYTLMMHGNRARKLKLSTISDLAAYVKKNPRALIIGVNPEFWGRPDGFKNLMKFYGFRVPPQNIKLMATGITYTALKEGKIDLGMGFSTDGRIAAWGFINLKDNQKFFPVYNPAPVVRQQLLDKYPEIASVLQPLTQLTTQDMQQLNKAVDVDRKSVHQVAQSWLKSKSIIEPVRVDSILPTPPR
jgi:osmoprotectant transport system substrate-binding protein